MTEMSTPISASSLFVLLAVFMLVPAPAFGSISDPRHELIYRKCSKYREHNTSSFTDNVASAINMISNQLPNTGYGFATVEKPPDTLYVLAQCMGDLSSTDCMLCMSQANGVLSACFPASGGRVYLDGCFLREETYSFYHETVTPQDVKMCGSARNAKGTDETATREVIGELLHRAARYRGYAVVSRNVSDTGTAVFAMADCWRALDDEMCSYCLREAANAVFSCLPATEGKSLNAGCFLRYSVTHFTHSGGSPSTASKIDSNSLLLEIKQNGKAL